MPTMLPNTPQVRVFDTLWNKDRQALWCDTTRALQGRRRDHAGWMRVARMCGDMVRFDRL